MDEQEGRKDKKRSPEERVEIKRKEIKQNPINRNKSHKAGTVRRRKGTNMPGT